jgi:Big-like domain-containing protein/VCBS repeat protein/FG-GAP repeat protein
MRTNTQLKTRFAAVLIALGTLAIVTTTVQLIGARQSKRPVATSPQDVSQSVLALDVVEPNGNNAERVAGNRLRKRRINAQATTPSAISFVPAVPYYSGAWDAYSVAVADVNNDGKPDVLVANYCIAMTNCITGLVGVLLGNGDGTFQAAVTYSSGGSRAVSLVVADVNGDGKPDVLVANQYFSFANRTTGGVGVLLGNGDGTFQPTLSFASGKGIGSSVAVADLNGDGKADLVVTTWGPGSMGVLLGNGDGTFQPVVTYPAGGPQASTIADVNGDGKPDVLIADGSGAGVLLGNGDGTFQPEVMYSSGGSTPTSIVAGDLNDDGKQDLVVMNFDSRNVGVLLGNGDGTFQPAVTYSGADGAGTPSVALADVNGDGKLDLVAVIIGTDSKGDGGVSVFLGNGDGTFEPNVVFSSGGNAAWALAVADVNGDGKPDVVAANLQLTNHQPLKGFVGVLINSTVFATPTTTKLASSPNPSLFGQAVAFTATVSSTGGTPPNGEIITFKNGSAVLGTGSLSGGSTTLTTSSLPVGTSTITASYTGDSTFGANTSPGLKQVVNPTSKSPTSTSLVSSLNPSIYGQKVTWTATVTTSGSITPTGTVRFMGSGNAIGSATLNSSGVATLTRANLNAGTLPVTAVYLGDAANLGSTSAVVTQVVVQATSSAKLTSSPNPSAQSQAVTFTARISSPTVLPKGLVTFKAGTTVLGTAQLSGGKATLAISSLPVGSTRVTVTYNGNSNIAKSSASVTQTVQ